MNYRTAPFSVRLNDPYSRFKEHAADTEYLKNGTRYRHSFNEIASSDLHMPYSTVFVQNDLE